MEYEHIVHSFEPVYDKDSEILILGTLPSVKSRENNFYYGHKQKKAMLLAHRIALWDVIQSCDIKGSSDSSIKNVQPTDIGMILEKTNMTQIYANGNKAGQLYKRYQFPITGIEATVLPSTSPANAAWSLARLCEAWKTILHDL